MFDYRQIEAFGAVIEYGGFDRAADALGLTQSAVTQRVKHLESYVGEPLLVRSNPPVPTKAGIPLYSHFKKIRLLEEDLERGTETRLSGTALSLGVGASTLGSWFLPVLRLIMKFTLVDLHVGEAKVVHRLLQLGNLAGCISLRSQPSRGCSVTYLGNLVLRCVATKEFKKYFFPLGITAESMTAAPAILFHPESQMMRMYQKKVLKIAPFDVPSHIIPSQSEYLHMISSGVAYGFLPDPLFRQVQADHRLIDLSPLAPIIIPQYWHRWGIDSELLEHVTLKIQEAAQASLLRDQT
ncbi:ArgP/LysG family DNA-binding transcriptional regulator [Sediminispirochaeta smaragdinae]|uniref:Transcriptional regulator, LysR family n=1 Tax=Sediminispirochaeta smaragdinae (strain DSM 11293 / JCM 15392 / SEBR 4228) TaxID=573413 RepID=E1R7A0_SEDSS|nr:ArgP/LysG family DNA-binding transcriptional regulator [Sediminispirochaeta smaragdinae]ADK82605.1 transcriptional regulator, LysR family [Sediminispirochaeta smaragdinae DSM 11293]